MDEHAAPPPEDPAEEPEALAPPDDERALAAQFAVPDARARLLAFIAVVDEIERAPERVSEPMIGEIRLAWWRDALSEACEGPQAVRRHPAAMALADALAGMAHPPTAAELHALVDGQVRRLDPAPFADLEALIAHVDATTGVTMRLAARFAGDAAEDPPWITPAARAWGLMTTARRLGRDAPLDRPGLPEDARRAAGVRRSALKTGAEPDAAREALEPVLAAALDHHGEARAQARPSPAVWPAVGHVALTPALVRALRAPGRDPYAPLTTGRLGQRARLVWACARGRI